MLGAALRDIDRRDELVAALPSPDFFQDPKHRLIYQTMLDLYTKGQPADPIHTYQLLKQTGKLIEAGGTYVFDLCDEAPWTPIKYLLKQITEQKRLSEMIAFCREAVRSAERQDLPPADLIAQIETRATEAMQPQQDRIHAVPIGDILACVIQRIDDYQTGKYQESALMTGMNDLDYLVGGFKPGRYYVIAGPTSHGKTQLALQISIELACKQHSVAFLTREVPALDLAERVIYYKSKIDSQRIKWEKIKPAEWDQITRASTSIQPLPFHIIDAPKMNVPELWAQARDAKRRHDIEMLVIDYMQLIDPDKPKETREREMAYVSANIKSIARELEIPVIAVSQVSRQWQVASKQKLPLQTLRESGMIENDADVVIFVSQKEDHVSEIRVAKNRDGKKGTFDMAFVAGRLEQMQGEETDSVNNRPLRTGAT